MNKLKILIADDHTLVRMGISALLTAQKDMTVVGQAKNGKQAVDEARRLQPDIVIMDLVMPVMDGIAATGEIRSAAPDAKVLVLTTYTTSDGILSALKNGAWGAVFKSDANDELLTAIRTAAGGERFVSPAILRQFENDPPADPLSPRQKDILQRIIDGMSNAEIADRLGISPAVVRDHTSVIFEKLGVTNRTEAVAAALRKHLMRF